MPPIWNLYKNAIDPTFVDNYGCWTLLGRRDFGTEDPFTFPVTLTVDGFTSVYTEPTVFYAAVNIESPSEQELLFEYSCGSCSVPCTCDDSELVIFVFEDCSVPCTEITVTIQVIGCDFSILSVTGGTLVNPVYQWQSSQTQFGIYTDVPGETGTTLIGENDVWYQLVVTDLDTGCVYTSNALQGDCPPPSCAIVIDSFTYNETLDQFEVSFTPTAGSGTYDITISQSSTPNLGNCLSSSNWSTICNDEINTTTFTCPFELPIQDSCYLVYVYDVSEGACNAYTTLQQNGTGCIGSVEVVQSGGNCAYQGIDFEDCNNPNGDLITMTVADNAFAPQYCIDFEYSNSCGENFFGTETENLSGFTYREMYMGHTLKNMTLLYIDQLEISSTTGGSAIISFDPSGPNAANYVSGPGGTLSNVNKMACDLGITTTASNTIPEWQTNMRIALINALDFHFGASLVTNYLGLTQFASGVLSITETTVDFAPFANIRINFRNKHNPTGLWCGFSTTAAATLGALTGTVDQTNISNNLLYTWVNNPQSQNSVAIDCGSVTMTVRTSSTFAPLAGTQFDTVLVTNPATFQIINNPVLNCGGGTVLTANTTNIPNPVYIWSTGETSQSISVSPGTYDLTVVGSDGCEYDVANIVVT